LQIDDLATNKMLQLWPFFNMRGLHNPVPIITAMVTSTEQ